MVGVRGEEGMGEGDAVRSGIGMEMESGEGAGRGEDAGKGKRKGDMGVAIRDERGDGVRRPYSKREGDNGGVPGPCQVNRCLE